MSIRLQSSALLSLMGVSSGVRIKKKKSIIIIDKELSNFIGSYSNISLFSSFFMHGYTIIIYNMKTYNMKKNDEKEKKYCYESL